MDSRLLEIIFKLKILRKESEVRVDKEKCIGCGQCQPYCPVGAISLLTKIEGGRETKLVEIDFDECVECSNCLRCADCPTEAIYQQELVWPRTIRYVLSDILSTGATTGIPGRGTEEGKTNDVTGRFKRGYVGIALEFGRPVLGTRIRDVERVAKAMATLGVEFERLNPTTALMENPKTGKFKEDVLNEKVMSLILESTIEIEKLGEVLDCLKRASHEIDTVFSLDLITRTNQDWSIPTESAVRNAGFWLAPNGKTCVGLGRPVAKED